MNKFLTSLTIGLVFAAFSLNGDTQDMLDEIRQTTEQTEHYTKVSEIRKDVLETMEKVDRSEFVHQALKDAAFLNQPLPIGHGQTISQPYIVALMTHVLEVQDSDKVLEIGTGSGYQAAILAELADEVYTIEIVSELAEEASERLKRLGYENIWVKDGDGWFGWPEHAPFDKIIVTAVAEEIPPKLINQLAIGGKLIMPVGDPGGRQDLELLTKTESGTKKRSILPVQFVPLTGEGVLTLREDKQDQDSE